MLFFCSDMAYLGHHISNEGIIPDESKFLAINNFLTPKDADDVPSHFVIIISVSYPTLQN